MKGVLYFLLILALLFAGIYFLVMSGFASPGFIGADHFRVDSVNLTPPVSFGVHADLNFKNATPFPATATALRCTVSVEEITSFVVVQSQDVHIMPFDTFVYPVYAPVRLNQLSGGNWSDLLNLGNMLKDGVNIHFKGTIQVKVLGITRPVPIDYTYPYKIF